MNDPETEASTTLQSEPTPPSEPIVPAARRFPWPPAADENVLFALAETWRWSVFQPSSFFRAMPPTGYVTAIAYFLPIGIITAALNLFWSNLFDAMGIIDWIPAALGVATPSATDRLIDFLLSPLWLPVLLFVCALLMHGSLRLVAGASRPLVTTTRVLAFAYGPRLFTIVPLVGSLVGGIWSLVLIVIGLREAHATTTGRAAAALLIPLAFLFVLLIAVGILVVMGILVLGASALGN